MATLEKEYLKVLIDPADATLDIVAIHGLDPTGTQDHGMKTWTSRDNKMWLRDFLPQQLPKARIMVFGWNANVVFDPSINGIRDHARLLLTRLYNLRISETRRPIIFVCHSLGGLLIKRALVMAKSTDKYLPIQRATYAIVFFGTPHNGGNGVYLGKFVSAVARQLPGARPKNSLLESLEKNSYLAADLREDFREHLMDYMVVNFYEDKNTKVLSKDVGLVVDKSSATLNLPTNRENVLSLGGDHSSICRFETKESSSYGLVEGEMGRLALEAERSMLLAQRLEPEGPWSEPLSSLAKRSEIKGPIIDRNKVISIATWLERSGGVRDQSDTHDDIIEPADHLTGSWLLRDQRFQNWKRTPCSWLWLYGIPGCGKTVMNAFAVRHLRDEFGSRPGYAVVHFYFSFASWTGDIANIMLCSILLQLMDQHEQVPPAITSLFEKCRDGTLSPKIAQLMSALKEVLASRLFHRTFILLDALDECEDNDKSKIQNALQQIHEWKLDPMHVLITSRHEHLLAECFNDIMTPENQVQIQTQVVDEDIKTWLETRLQNSKWTNRWRNWEDADTLRSTVIKSLLLKSSGMFLLVKLQLDLLGSSSSTDEVNETLESLPDTLYETFDRILKRIKKQDQPKAHDILLWLTFARRPLWVEEVEWVTAFSKSGSEQTVRPGSRIQNGKEEILRICSSMVKLVEEFRPNKQYQRQVQLAHSTVKEYLLCERELRSQELWVGEFQPETAHRVIAQGCLAYLQQCTRPEHFKGSSEADYLRKWSLAPYVAQFWPEHSRLSGEVSCSFNEECPLHSQMRSFVTNDVAMENSIRLFDPHDQSDTPKFNKPVQSKAWYYVALYGLKNLVDLLLPKNDLDANAGFDGNALQAASAGGFDDTVEYLLDNGAEIAARPTKDAQDALQVASYYGHESVVRILLNRGAQVTAFGGFFGYALQAAAYECHEEIVKMLLEAGADPNARGGQWDSALTAASWSGGVGTVELLLEYGADIDYMSAKKTTALQAAACDGRLTTVETLLNRNADPNLVSNAAEWFGTALCAAAHGGFVTIAERLVAKGAQIDLAGGRFSTPLVAAVTERRPEMAKWLIDNGALPNDDLWNLLGMMREGFDRTMFLPLRDRRNASRPDS